MTTTGDEVALGTVLQNVRVPLSEAGGFLMALSETAAQYGYPHVSVALRDAAMHLMDAEPVAP